MAVIGGAFVLGSRVFGRRRLRLARLGHPLPGLLAFSPPRRSLDWVLARAGTEA